MLIRRLRIKANGVVWSIFDFGVISLANFSWNLLVARYSTAEEYGKFVLVFTFLYLMYAIIQSPLTLEPMIIIGASKDSDNFRQYVTNTTFLHILISVSSLIFLLLLGWLVGALGNHIYAEAIFLSSVPLVFMNLRYLIRSYYVSQGNFQKAFLNDALVLIGIFGFIFFAKDGITVLVATMLMTLGEVCAVLFFVIFHYKSLFKGLKNLGISLLEKGLGIFAAKNIQENWTYGKWLIPSNASVYVYLNLQFLLLPALVSIASLAGYRAAFLVSQPISLISNGIEAFIWKTSVDKVNESLDILRIYLKKMILFPTILIALYILITGIFGRQILEIVFKGKFGDFAPYVWSFLFVGLFGFWIKIVSSGLRVLKDTRSLFRSTFWAAVVGGIGLIALTEIFGVTGSAISYFISALLLLLLLFLNLKRTLAKETKLRQEKDPVGVFLGEV